MTRQLVTRRTVKDIQPIPNADTIECATVDGWQCVVRKGEYQPGDPCLYFEIDSFLPESDKRFAFLMGNKRTFLGNSGHRLKTIKFRKQISQGLLMHPEDFPELEGVETDLAEVLGVKKWEPPLAADMVGVTSGPRPHYIPKTDQERIQNIPQEELDSYIGDVFEVTVKLDGTSTTAYFYNGELGVCSRNLNYIINEQNIEHDTRVRIASESGLLDALKAYGRNIAIQGELIGEGIQKNNEQIKGHALYIFDVWDIDNQEYLLPYDRVCLLKVHILPKVDQELVARVPTVEHFGKLPSGGDDHASIQSILKMASGESLNKDRPREGVVWKNRMKQFSFKAVNNDYLLERKARRKVNPHDTIRSR